MTGRRERRGGPLLRALAFAVVGCAALVAVDACIVTDPPGDLPRLPETRPTIVRGSVVPSASSVMGRWPDLFIVPVELVDPTVRIFWAAFVDYNPANGEGLVDFQPSDFDPASTVGRTRILQIPIATPSLDRCHTVEIIVALRLSSDFELKGIHTPAEPGGDTVTWFFNPSGDLAGCPVLDAGIDAAPRDASQDGEGGPP